MNAGPGGFAGAPVSKGLVLLVAGSSVLAQTTNAWQRNKGIGAFLSQARVGQLGHILIFRHPGVLIFGTALLYYFRVFERQWGSRKYGSFCSIVLGAACVLEQAAARLLSWPAIPGPYPLLYANFVTFFFDVPATQHFAVFGVPLSDKAFVYLAGLQLLIVTPRQALLGAAVGLLAGAAYRTKFLGLQKLQVPKAVSSFLGRTVGRLLSGSSPPQQPPTIQNRPSAPAPAPPVSHQANAPPLPHPAPQALQQLLAMGFDQAQATRALQTSNNDVQMALAQLL